MTKNNDNNNAPVIVAVDIETSPIKGYTWGMYEENVLYCIEPSKIIGAAWKYIPATGKYRIPNNKVYVKALPDYKGYKAGVLNDEKLVKELWALLDEADIIIAHNGQSFDVKKLNARFIYYGLGAPSSYKIIDTKNVAKKYFRFDSNKLDTLGDYLHEGRKQETGGFDLWLKCIAGDPAAWTKMKKYNAQDIVLLERIYLRLRPFMQDHPNLNVICHPDKGEHNPLSCPTCLSTDTVRRGFQITRTGRYQRFFCKSCKSWGSGQYQKAKGVELR